MPRTLLFAGLLALPVGAYLVADREAHAGPESTTTALSASNTEGTAALDAIVDQPLEDHQAELLDLAFRAVTAIPAYPHIKERSRAQEEVVALCFELNQPRRALAYGEKIENWRRGGVYADFAYYAAQKGEREGLTAYLDQALEIAKKDQDNDEGQAWRIDRVRAKIARTHLALGERSDAMAAVEGIAATELGPVLAMDAVLTGDKSFEAHVAEVDRAIETGEFEQVQNAMKVCTQLFDQHYDDEERRTRIREAIQSSWGKLPGLVHLETTMELARSALGHGDSAHALELVEETAGMMDDLQWSAEVAVPLRAKLAGLRGQAGDPEAARKEADAALALFEEEREKIYDVFRGAVLRPLAECYQTIGAPGAAQAMYRRALEEGALNPNSRPNALDLSATCLSMLRAGVEPEAALQMRMHEIFEAFDDPW